MNITLNELRANDRFLFIHDTQNTLMNFVWRQVDTSGKYVVSFNLDGTIYARPVSEWHGDEDIIMLAKGDSY